MSLEIAVLIPCYNEEKTIAQVVQKAKEVLPCATVYVYDNNSSDDTALVALKAGAVVRSVEQKGKGSVIRRMFADIDADVYLMTDGDLTYDLDAAPLLIERLIKGQKDMVVGTRVEQNIKAYRFGHRFGNQLLTCLVRALFGVKQTDMLSGYRVFSKRFVKIFPALSKGFEIETELNIFTATQKLPFAEVKTRYFDRPEGSKSKLSTFKDGFKILKFILLSFAKEHPIFFFFGIAAILGFFALDTQIHPKFADHLACFALASILTGLFLHQHMAAKREQKRIIYMTSPFPKENTLEEDKNKEE